MAEQNPEHRPAQKTKRRTRERVLETGLRLFNLFGEPNVTTTTIADEMVISPGNLYYHFRNKEEIVNDIFAAFSRELSPILAAPTQRSVNIEDVWLFLHVLFETIWKYRFLYRDLPDLLSRNRTLELQFKRILEQKIATATAILSGLQGRGAVALDAADIDALAKNMMVVATYWLSFAYVRNPRQFEESAVVAEGVVQVLALYQPYLVGATRELFAQLAAEYGQQRGQQPRAQLRPEQRSR